MTYSNRLKISRVVSLCVLVAFCACSSGNAQSGENGEAVATIMIVSERAYRSGTRMEGAECTAENLEKAGDLDWNNADAGLGGKLLEAINRGELDGDSFDWNTAHGVAKTLVGDELGFIDGNAIFLVYSVTFDADSGVAIVTVEVHKGNPYDADSEAVLTVSGSAIIGEDADFGTGEPVQIFSPCTAIYFAACDAIQQLLATDFIGTATGGPTSGPPSSGG